MGEPKLRFKADDGSDFPDWEEKTLGDLGVFVRGLTYDKTQAVETNGVAVMRSNNISSDGTLDYENGVQLVSKEPSEEQLLRKNDIVICMANGSDRLVGKAAKYDGGYKEPSRITVGAFCGIFRSSAPALPWWFQSDEYQRFLYLGKQGGNGALANLKGKDIENISVMFPADIDEQHIIADFLSAVDAVIAAQQAEVDAWEQRKKGVMQKLFSQEVRFKADDGSDFLDWEEKTLGDLGVFVRGLTYDKTQAVETNGVAVMRSNNISSDGTLDYENGVQLVSKEPSEEQLLRKNDIVICMANGSDRLVGKAAKYDGGYKEPSRITVGAFCGIFRSSAPALPWWFQSDEYQRFLYLGKQGGNGALANLKGKDIENISVMFPADIDEQRKIADCLSSMDEVIQKSKDELAKWRELKKGLLQQMFV